MHPRQRKPSEPLTWQVHDDLPQDAADAVDAGLTDFNATAAPLTQVRTLGCFARVDSGAVIGGAVGRTWGECCELQMLWVADSHRRQGIATRLVGMFEARAMGRGCRVFYLETFTFQAPEFYIKLGYRIASEIRGFPAGIAKYLMIKQD